MTHLRRLSVVSPGLLLALWLTWALAVPVRAADPLRVVLLVDSSTSMASMLTEFRAGLNAFITGVPDDVEIALISTGGQIRVRVPPTTDRQRLHEAAGRFASDGGANSFLDTMLECDKRFLKPARDRRPLFVVLTTDPPSLGDPPLNRYNDFVLDFMRRGGRAHAIVIRNTQQNGMVSAILDNLTKNTDGVFTVIAVGNSLASRMRELAEQVAAQQ
jgi:hypothetical protein